MRLSVSIMIQKLLKKTLKIILFGLVLLIVTIGYRLFGSPHSNINLSIEKAGAADPSPDPSPSPSPDS